MEPSAALTRPTAEMLVQRRAVMLVVWLAIVVGVCALAGGMPGLVYGGFGMLAGYWVSWTSAQHAEH